MTDTRALRRWTVAAISLAALVAAHAATQPLTALVEAVLARGPTSTLPAHLAVVLGVSAAGQTTAVKQAVMREGQTVHTINVPVAKPDDVVLMIVDERAHATRAYRVSSAGVLRKAVSYQSGSPAVERSLKAARADFADEVKFWTKFGLRPDTSK